MRKINSFLIEANRNGYASDNPKDPIKEKDGSTSIFYKSGDWKMHDNYFGGEPFGGREIVFYQNKPFWIMVYYGKVLNGFDHKEIYPFLKDALKTMPIETPFRGKEKFSSDKFTYENKVQGDVENFSGKELIYKDGQECFWTKYSGGLIDIIKQ